VSGDVGDGRTADAAGDVVPAEVAVHHVSAVVEPIASQRGHVDAADEGDLAVDDDQLLVVAVQRPFVGVERASDPGAADEILTDPTHVPATERHHRQWRARPEQHPHLDPLGQLAE